MRDPRTLAPASPGGALAGLTVEPAPHSSEQWPDRVARCRFARSHFLRRCLCPRRGRPATCQRADSQDSRSSCWQRRRQPRVRHRVRKRVPRTMAFDACHLECVGVHRSTLHDSGSSSWSIGGRWTAPPVAPIQRRFFADCVRGDEPHGRSSGGALMASAEMETSAAWKGAPIRHSAPIGSPSSALSLSRPDQECGGDSCSAPGSCTRPGDRHPFPLPRRTKNEPPHRERRYCLFCSRIG